MVRLLSRLGRAHDWVTDAGYVIAAASLFAMAASYVIEVVARYFFNRPTDWVSITVAHLLLVTVFMMLPHATRAVSHIGVNLIFQILPRRSRHINLGISVVGFLVCGLAAWISLGENLRQYAQTIYTEGNIQFPKWWVSPFITYGFACSALWFLRLAGDPRPRRPRLAAIPHLGDA